MADQQADLIWRTEQRKVADLMPMNRNPRTLSIEQQEHLTRSLKKFNLVEVPAINMEDIMKQLTTMAAVRDEGG